MSCRHYELGMDGADTAFSVDASNITFGQGCLSEAGDVARSLGIGRIAMFTDQTLADQFMYTISLDIQSFVPLFAQRCVMGGWLPGN